MFVIPSPCLTIQALMTDSNLISSNAKETTSNSQHIQGHKLHDLTLGRISWYKDGASSQNFYCPGNCVVTIPVKIC